MDTKITDNERKELDALLIQRDELSQKIKVILDKHPHCFECGAFEWELHELGCEHEFCPKCGEQLSVCKHDNDNDFQDFSRLPFGFFEYSIGEPA